MQNSEQQKLTQFFSKPCARRSVIGLSIEVGDYPFQLPCRVVHGGGMMIIHWIAPFPSLLLSPVVYYWRLVKPVNTNWVHPRTSAIHSSSLDEAQMIAPYLFGVFKVHAF